MPITPFHFGPGAALGACTHVLLDSVMHADIRPLAPFSDANALLNLVPLDSLHLICIGLAVLALAIHAGRRWLRRRS